ncbi:hypothetical protein CONLIGDRAFT_621593 [Coniochaeta ligniaria NRRL 30616]|uniref:Xylanolytic transcriptional activator regulatory domain-containing protein n=1 Tax=Coniochaeta ligniaria NRRL 30616 TaxID=1408157 RepID=A0A1J7IEL4_9PEZI|nr:hypothetical protein CONLIGDRAFT_621593 [Coniochaeta ligniaria NRRL 30616]
MTLTLTLPASLARDQVTRHERILHADGQEQRQDQQPQGSNQEYIADEVNVAWAQPVRPAAPQTPPRDLEEHEAYQNPGGPGQRDEAGLSPSSSSVPSSSIAGTVGSRRPPSESCTCCGAARSDKMIATAIATAMRRASADETNISSTITDISTNTQRQFSAIHDDYEPIYGSPDVHTTNYPISREHGTSGSLDQSHMPFFFSPMPDVDLNLAAFPFSPLPGDMTNLGHYQHNPQMTDDFSLQPIQMGVFDAMSDISHPAAQVIPQFDATEGRTAARRDTPNSPDTCGIPLLIQEDEPRSRPVLTLDDTAYLSIRNDLMQRLELPDHEIDIPSAQACQTFLSSYITNFHGHHLPIIHLQTLCPWTAPSPLILAMCSIGALYRLDRRRARKLYDIALRCIKTVPRPTQDDDEALVKEYHLWHVQAKMILTFYATMSGENDLFLRTMQENGFYSVLYSKVRIALGARKTGPSRMTWHDWIEHESWKRVLGGIVVTSTLTMVLFDINPGFNASQDLEFEAFHDDALWDAESSNEWRELRTNSVKEQQNPSRRRTLKEVFIDVMLERNNGSPYQVSSAFSALVLMHAVVVHMWHRVQVAQAFTGCHSSSSDWGHDQLGRSLLESATKSLARCDAFVRGGAGNETSLAGADDDAMESSLTFSCQAVRRIAYIRLFKPANPSSCRINLISVDPAEMDASITSYVTAEMERTPQLLGAVAKAFEGLRIPVKLGHLLVRKTAAFRWSVEHAVAGWEGALLVTKWVHSVELSILNGVQPSPDERDLVTLIQELLQEAEYERAPDSVSIAAGVATTWGWFLQDVWIWGITPRMGSALELLAKAYERVRRANHSRPLEAGSS